MSKVKKILQSHVFLTLVAIVVAFLVGAIFLVVMGYDPIKIYGTLIEGIFSKPKYLAYSVVYATPLIFVGLAVAFSFKTGVFNIGAEGQFVVGSMAACLVGIFVDAPAIIHVPLCFLAAAAAGAVWGVIVAFMKTKWGINEVLSMIMFNWIAFYLSNYLVTIPAIHSDGTAEATKNIAESAQILLPQSMRSALAPTSNYGILIAIVLVVAVYLILDKTILGYELKAVGYNKNASEYGGISVNRAVLTAMAISGGLAGMGGAVHLMGMGERISLFAGQEGFGFEGISVALIGASNPFGVLLSGLFYGALKYGGSKLNLIQAPSEIVKVITGTIVFFIAISHVFKIKKRVRGAR
ncbi:MAG: ABC transporter permease [Lachnospiraceae bacterium]|nr:ABC transporter permease [Lachnospiraceae bacterium]